LPWLSAWSAWCSRPAALSPASLPDLEPALEYIIGIILLIVYLIAIIDILKSPMDLVKKIIWIVVVLVLPVIGTILWFLIGKKV
jgi:hypothetical protein